MKCIKLTYSILNIWGNSGALFFLLIDIEVPYAVLYIVLRFIHPSPFILKQLMNKCFCEVRRKNWIEKMSKSNDWIKNDEKSESSWHQNKKRWKDVESNYKIMCRLTRTRNTEVKKTQTLRVWLRTKWNKLPTQVKGGWNHTQRTRVIRKMMMLMNRWIFSWLQPISVWDGTN